MTLSIGAPPTGPSTSSAHPVAAAVPSVEIPLFGARTKARELATDVTRLRSDVALLSSQKAQLEAECDVAKAEIARLGGEIDRLGILPLIELEHRVSALAAEEQADTERITLTRSVSTMPMRYRRCSRRVTRAERNDFRRS
ncbi:outer membrane murein-binding lipoprotein Lpp [Allocatelliglobosispora scoriae]|uniref:Outer membrane murein-binding lipoprotein Lpp n=1 Tax=Allocatelliglobosispora scoriae TaxID=643052 RepID=A0A841C1D2_9ACTN|nr:hypothetical protein [Allocatelliglobosispora scoriae]MBB5872780.1 outer membrane murein-binding lipoprotein Lpp [Allocatelliglobosispora scoriae]